MKASFRRLLFKREGNRATWEYPFAVAGINISFMLTENAGSLLRFVKKFYYLYHEVIFLSCLIVTLN